ncbi:MAG: hypothetical protein AAF700_00690, partial [Pseudomonadota bacterium]
MAVKGQVGAISEDQQPPDEHWTRWRAHDYLPRQIVKNRQIVQIIDLWGEPHETPKKQKGRQKPERSFAPSKPPNATDAKSGQSPAEKKQAELATHPKGKEA